MKEFCYILTYSNTCIYWNIVSYTHAPRLHIYADLPPSLVIFGEVGVICYALQKCLTLLITLLKYCHIIMRWRYDASFGEKWKKISNNCVAYLSIVIVAYAEIDSLTYTHKFAHICWIAAKLGNTWRSTAKFDTKFVTQNKTNLTVIFKLRYSNLPCSKKILIILFINCIRFSLRVFHYNSNTRHYKDN